MFYRSFLKFLCFLLTLAGERVKNFLIKVAKYSFYKLNSSLYASSYYKSSLKTQQSLKKYNFFICCIKF